MTRERRFYVPPEDQDLIDQLMEILKRDGKSLSKWIREQARPYVNLHQAGNPQQCLDTIMKLGKAYRANECFYCGNYPKVQGIRGRDLILLCDECFDKKKNGLSGWRRIR